MRYLVVLLMLIVSPPFAAVVDSDGVNSLGTGLDGAGVLIGRAEIFFVCPIDGCVL